MKDKMWITITKRLRVNTENVRWWQGVKHRRHLGVRCKGSLAAVRL